MSKETYIHQPYRWKDQNLFAASNNLSMVHVVLDNQRSIKSFEKTRDSEKNYWMSNQETTLNNLLKNYKIMY